ncbi:phosphoenolpyruvate synthase [Seinonella peptonophila]|uniref:Rifampicin phosphotransferase n=1 Tax=Seinonella peptonophila TaxID=112248 RepID=A0A1M4ZS65_9BACL|nr:phosphoenolpyruvate synthase [Seinonella peptonophila]SHF20930.1 phosphoenolpyruvate synthase [Seinonella peptonophila]
MSSYVLHFQEIEKSQLLLVGGKGLNLGELSRIQGIQVPEGFCVTTKAYQRVIEQNKEFQGLLNQLALLKIEDQDKISEISGRIRETIENIEIPSEITKAVVQYLSQFGEEHAYAVRSSATAEDLPTASFAGQQDTYLNIIGGEAILRHISKCWASLFTDRAVIYRMQNEFDHNLVRLSVVVQRMVFPQASGILFTADPITFNRKILSIDASFGLGEALVSGLVSADNYKVREGKIIEKTISPKKLAIYALKEGGTVEQKIENDQQNLQTLTDKQILQLEYLGRKIESYFGCPQDIEWCMDGDEFYIVQSRPVTTLYPVPEVSDGKTHIFLSYGHKQMMTEAIKPLGISFLEFLGGNIPFRKVGGRLFVDITHELASSIWQRILPNTLGQSDPLVKSALLNLIKRDDLIKSLPQGKKAFTQMDGLSWNLPYHAIKIYQQNDPTIIQQIISQNEISINDLRQRISKVSGEDLFAFILEDHKQLKKILADPQSMGILMIGFYATYWINNKMEKWLGEKNAADILSQSVPNNITSEMGLELLDVADVVRQYPEVIEYFHHPNDETFFEDLTKLKGGSAVSEAIRMYLEKYGVRCVGEIDITRTRWAEQPTALIPMILNNIRNFKPNSREIKFEQGRLEAEKKEQDLLIRLEQLPSGKQKVRKTKKMISILRNFAGYREYPKYNYIRRYYIYKQALLKEAITLVQKGVIQKREDIYYLSFEELREVVRTNQLNYTIINERREEFKSYKNLTPPRIMTSEGEIIVGKYSTENIPSDALAGIPASSGIVEGRARVVLTMKDAEFADGDILVTAYTDPSWTPLFLSIKGLVTEVGGVGTHGSVIAREYGIPAVVGVDNVTKLIKDGQRIRVNGTEGYIEIL